MFDYADERQLRLTGYAFEKGINDFAMASEEEYITQVAIRIKDSSKLVPEKKA